MIYLLKTTEFSPEQRADPWATQTKFFQHIEIGRLISRFDKPGLTVGCIGSQQSFNPLMSFSQAVRRCVIDSDTGATGNGQSETPQPPYPVTRFRDLAGGSVIPDSYFDALISVGHIQSIGQAQTKYDCNPPDTPDPVQDGMRDAFCAQIAWVLKPGAVTIHIIDHAARNLSYVNNFVRAGLEPFDPEMPMPTVEDGLENTDAVRQQTIWQDMSVPMPVEERRLHGVLVGVWIKPVKTRRATKNTHATKKASQ